MSDDTAGVASPRDIIRPAIHRGIVDGSWEVSESDLDDATTGVLADLQRAGYSVVARVWVAQLDLTDDAGGYIGVHTTPEGAVAAVVKWAGDIGIEVADLTTESGSQTLDAHPKVASYGVSNVPVES